MRSAVATLTIAILLLALGACSVVMACALPDLPAAGHPCCPQHPANHSRTPATRMQGCPYDLLERGKTAPVQAFTPPSTIAAAAVPALQTYATPAPADRMDNSAGLFLRIRVLLI